MGAKVPGNNNWEISLAVGEDESPVVILNTILEEENWVVEDAETLHRQTQTETLDREMDTTIWVHQNMIKLSKLLWGRF